MEALNITDKHRICKIKNHKKFREMGEATNGRATMLEWEGGSEEGAKEERVGGREGWGEGGRLRPPPPGSKTWRAPAAGPPTSLFKRRPQLYRRGNNESGRDPSTRLFKT